MSKTNFLLIGIFIFLQNTYAEEKKIGIFDLYQKVIIKDPFISKEEYILESSEYKYKEVKSELYPKINATINQSQSRRKDSFNTQEYPSHDKGINLQQVIFDPELFEKISKEKYFHEKSNHEFQTKITERLLDFSFKYFALLEAIDNLNLAKIEYNTIERNLIRIQELRASQMASLLDLHDISYRKNILEADLFDFEQKIYYSKNLLEEFFGENINLNLKKPKNNIESLINEFNSLEEIKLAFFDNNQQLQSLKKEVLALESQVKESAYQHSPTVHMTASVQDSNLGSSGSRTNNYTYSKFGFNINIPIFSGGGINSRIKSSIAQKYSAQDNLKLQEIRLLHELENSFHAIKIKSNKFKALNSALIFAKESRTAYEKLFEYKLVNISDLLNSITHEFNIQKEIKKNQYELFNEYLKIKSYIGNIDADTFQKIDASLE